MVAFFGKLHWSQKGYAWLVVGLSVKLLYQLKAVDNYQYMLLRIQNPDRARFETVGQDRLLRELQ